MSTALPPPSAHDDMHCLYRDHSSWLRGWLRRRLGDGERAADLTQDTFLRLITGTVVHPLREPRNFLATVAKRVMVDHLRRRSLEQAYLQALAQQPELLEVSAEERVLMLEVLLQLDAMLDGLGPKVRLAFFLAQLQDQLCTFHQRIVDTVIQLVDPLADFIQVRRVIRFRLGGGLGSGLFIGHGRIRNLSLYKAMVKAIVLQGLDKEINQCR